MGTQHYIRAFLLPLLLVAILPTTSEMFQVQSSHFYTLSGYRTDNPLATVQMVAIVSTQTACAAFCIQDANCKTAEFDTKLNKCFILDTDSYNEDVQFINAPGYTLMAKGPLLGDLTGSGGKLVFRGMPYIGVSMYKAWLGQAPSSSGPAPPVGCVRKDNALPCNSHYRDPFMDVWLDVEQVNLMVYKQGVLKVSLSFNGQGADNRMWMAKDRLLSTIPWTDLQTETHFHSFNISGIENPERRFYISSYVEGCMFDRGWLLVSDQQVDGCSYVNSAVAEYPRIIYSPTEEQSQWYYDAEFADALLVSVQLSS